MRESPIRVLIVEDNQRHAELMAEELHRMTLEDSSLLIESRRSHCGEDALELLRRETADIVLLDYGLPDYDGLDLLEEIHAVQPGVPVVFVTNRASVKLAVDAIKAGASDYLIKDEHYLDTLPLILGDLIQKFRLREDNRNLKEMISDQSREINRLKSALEGRFKFRNIIASSPMMTRVLVRMERAIESLASVLIEGETGTGKEVIARAIHLNGSRREHAFVPQNCAALPEGLLESELFGVTRGAFTGADRDRKGLFEEADGGTLFLDEIGEMPPPLQAKILRILQDQEVRPLGSTRGHRVDVRIIAATNIDLEQAVAAGTFRKDLFYRLSVMPIRIPPLRDRKEDIPLLAEHFLRIYTQREGKYVRGFDPEVMMLLDRYDWPGNVRELENEVHRLVAFCSEGAKIGAELISDRVRGFRVPFQGQIDESSPLREILERVEAQVVADRLVVFRGNKSAAANSLGVNRETLYTKIAKHGIIAPSGMPASESREEGEDEEPS